VAKKRKPLQEYYWTIKFKDGSYMNVVGATVYEAVGYLLPYDMPDVTSVQRKGKAS